MKIALDLIYPDPQQPRREIPFALKLPSGCKPQEALKRWIRFVEGRAGSFAWVPYFTGNLEFPEPWHEDPVAARLAKLMRLAKDIYEIRLTNEITVIREVKGFMIETGERRWWATYLLHIAFPEDERWRQIEARMLESRSAQRQGSENSLRSNLNAIGTARQLALLLLDYYKSLRRDERDDFKDRSDFDSDLAYYAQVADGREYPIPTTRMENFLLATGLKNKVQLRFYRALLRLPESVWIDADDNDLSEGYLRSWMERQERIEEEERQHKLREASLSEQKEQPLMVKTTEARAFVTDQREKLTSEVADLEAQVKELEAADQLATNTRLQLAKLKLQLETKQRDLSLVDGSNGNAYVAQVAQAEGEQLANEEQPETWAEPYTDPQGNIQLPFPPSQPIPRPADLITPTPIPQLPRTPIRGEEDSNRKRSLDYILNVYPSKEELDRLPLDRKRMLISGLRSEIAFYQDVIDLLSQDEWDKEDTLEAAANA